MDASFEWLKDPHQRRSSLQLIYRCLRAGWLAGDGPEVAARRRALAEAIGALLADPTARFTTREWQRLLKIGLAMGHATLREQIAHFLADAGRRRWRFPGGEP